MHNNAADARYELAQVSTFLLQTLAEVVEGHGVDPARLCRGLGFTVEDLQDPTQRISYRQAVSMIQRALQVLPERGLGLWVGHQNVLGTLGLLGHVLSLCRTLRDAFDIGVRYQHSSGGIVTSSVYQQGETFFVEVECHLPSSEVQVFAIEEFFASLLVYGRALVSPAFEPLGIELIHAAPPYAGSTCACWAPRYASAACTTAWRSPATGWTCACPTTTCRRYARRWPCWSRKAPRCTGNSTWSRRWNGPSPATSAWAARSKGFPPN